MLSYIIDGPRDRQTDNKRDRQRETDRHTKRETDKTERDRKTERQVSSPVVGAQDRALVLGDVVQRLMAFMLNSGGFLSATHTHSISLLRSIPLVLAHLVLCS